MSAFSIPEDAVQLRTSICFASGLASKVYNRRWFRDTGRRDIQHELVGWPEGPTFALNSEGEQAANAATRGLLAVLPIVGNLLSGLGGGGSPFGKGGPSQPKEDSKDPANEVEDFPVMWAAPGTVARTLPWQLDPARCPTRHMTAYKTEAVLTERRLLILGSWPKESVSELWDVPRECIANAEVMPFSEGECDLRLTFTDESWVRLEAHHSKQLVNFLSGRYRIIRESDLSAGQRRKLAEYTTKLPSDAELPLITVLPSGVVRVQVNVPSKKAEIFQFFMDENGDYGVPQRGEL